MLPFHLFLSCSINLSVLPDAGRARSIPNTKNNHFSVIGVVGGAGKGCVSVGVGVGYLQLTRIRHGCSFKAGEGVKGSG